MKYLITITSEERKTKKWFLYSEDNSSFDFVEAEDATLYTLEDAIKNVEFLKSKKIIAEFKVA